MISLDWIAQPEGSANGVSVLCEEQSGWIIGKTVSINGGPFVYWRLRILHKGSSPDTKGTLPLRRRNVCLRAHGVWSSVLIVIGERCQRRHTINGARARRHLLSRLQNRPIKDPFAAGLVTYSP